MKSSVVIRGIVFSALFAALLAVFSLVTVPLGFSPVPVTLENMIVMLAGALLGPLYGFLSMVLVVLLTAAGVHMLHGAGGIGIIMGPTGGYIVAWPFCALLTGWFVKWIPVTRGTNSIRRVLYSLSEVVGLLVCIEVFGSLFTYVIGVPWLAISMKWSFSKAMVGGFYPFLAPDFVKVIVVTILVFIIRRIYPPERFLQGRAAGVIRMSSSQPDA